MIQLTDAGRALAERDAADLITARVALWGREQGWPETHVAVAIDTYNEKAIFEGTDLAADVADALTPRGLR